MNNFLVSFNKFIKNKNTVTIIGIVLILVLLYYGYNRTVKTTINPVSVPVAKKTIGSRKLITHDDITFTQVAAVTLNDNVVRSESEIVGKYTNLNVTIPEGSMFYRSWLVEKNKIPGSWIEQINTDEGYEAFYLDVDFASTFGNNILPNSYIDLYMSITTDAGIMYGRLIKDMKVLVVHDGNANDVFDDASAPGQPSKLGFALSHDFYILLYKVTHMSDVTLEISPRGTSTKNKQGMFVSSQTLRDYIDTHSASLNDEIDVNPNPTQDNSVVKDNTNENKETNVNSNKTTNNR